MQTTTNSAHASPGSASSTSARSLSHYEQSITECLALATRPWLSVADAFRSADAELAPSEFKQLCANVDVGYSIARKLIKVSNCQRLQNYANQLACVTAWSTLYQITLLDDASFAEFAAAYLDGAGPKVLKRVDVERFKAAQTKGSASGKLLPYFTLEIDAAAALTDADEQLLLRVETLLEDNLRGKCHVKWHVPRPTATTAFQ